MSSSTGETTSTGSESSGDPTDATDPTDPGSSSEDTGAPACADAPVVAREAIIDDFDTPGPSLPEVDGRVGQWFATNDGTGEQTSLFSSHTDTPAGSGTSTYTRVRGFSDWGAGIAVVLIDLDGLSCPMDASSFEGIEFWAKGSGPWVALVGSAQTVGVAGGGRCTEECDDHFGFSFSPTETWQLVRIRWGELAQAGWGTPAQFASTEVHVLQFLCPESGDFELAVDDVALFVSSANVTSPTTIELHD